MWQLVFGIAIACVSMYWAIHGEDISSIYHRIAGANWWLLSVVGAIFMLQQVMRSARQMRIIRSTHPQHTFRSSMRILCISFFFINILPLRMGELMRPLLLLDEEDMPLGSGFAVVFVERMLDLLSAMIMAILVISLANIPLLENSWLQTLRHKLLLFVPLTSLALLLPIFASNWAMNVCSQAWIPQKIGELSLSFIEQLSALRKTGSLWRIIVETILIWLVSASMYSLAAMAFNIHTIGFVESIGLLAFTMIGMAAPSAPGFAGTYEASFVAGLLLFGCTNNEENFALAFCFHWWIFVVQSCSAIFFMVWDKTSFLSLWQKLRSTRKQNS